ncbi:MAG: calcium/sodium antiporter [Nanoarchaeota archaeon]|nr:calcium/sodium antiporter [Nanoarchaeota archaeon]
MYVYVLFVLGFVFLIKGASWLVAGVASLAKKLRMSNLLIGLTVLAIGTSLPELIINLFATINSKPEVAFGNIIGSNLSNTLLVLGIVALLVQFNIQQGTIRRELPFMFLSIVVLIALVNDKIIDQGINTLSRVDGLILLCFFSIFVYYVFLLAKGSRVQLEEKEVDVKTHKGTSIATLIVAGIVFISLGGQWVVNGAVALARVMGFSEFFISATIVAIGTSLPELTATIVAALKQDINLAIGNVIGSNIYNIFFVLGITAVVKPLNIAGSYNFDLGFLLATAFLLFIFMFTGKKNVLDRGEGISFLALYAIYIIILVIRG